MGAALSRTDSVVDAIPWIRSATFCIDASCWRSGCIGATSFVAARPDVRSAPERDSGSTGNPHGSEDSLCLMAELHPSTSTIRAARADVSHVRGARNEGLRPHPIREFSSRLRRDPLGCKPDLNARILTRAREVAMLRNGSIAAAMLFCVIAIGACSDDKQTDSGLASSQVGESCQRTSDCASGLACFGGACRTADVDVTPNEKVCKAIQCETADDCCSRVFQKDSACASAQRSCDTDPTVNASSCTFAQGPTCVCTPSMYSCETNSCKRIECNTPTDCCATRFSRPTSCDTYAAQCESDPVNYATYCTQAEGPSCVCNDEVYQYGCSENRCVLATTCTTDVNCTTTAPLCLNGHCVACVEDGDCAAGSSCRNNVCFKPQCLTDSDCPVFSVCQDDLTCLRVGCTNDRECMTQLDSYLAVCNKTTDPPSCDVSCERDSQCDVDGNPLRVCVDGHCKDPGCETDEECKIRLAPKTTSTTTSLGMQYVCRAAEKE